MTTKNCCPPKRRRLVEMGADGVCNFLDAGSEAQINSSNLDSSMSLFGKVQLTNVSPVQSLSLNDYTKSSVPMLSRSPYQKTTAFTSKMQAVSSVPVVQSSLEMEGELVEQAIDTVVNLPEAVSEVALMHKDQSTKIQRQQIILQALQEKLKEGQRQHDKTLQDIAYITRQIYLTEDQVAEKKRLCETYETKLNFLVAEAECLISTGKQIEEEMEEHIEKIKDYKEKMDSHKEITAEFECEKMPVRQKLQKVMTEVQAMKGLKEGMEFNKAEAEKITSGEVVNNLKEQQLALKQECEATKQRMEKKRNEIADQVAKQSQIKQNIDVLHKRNAAQLTRLKRQLKEIQSNNRQWKEQAVHLENAVIQARSLLHNQSV